MKRGWDFNARERGTLDVLGHVRAPLSAKRLPREGIQVGAEKRKVVKEKENRRRQGRGRWKGQFFV